LNAGEERMPPSSINGVLGYPCFCRPDQAAGGWNVVAARQKLLKVPLHPSIIGQIFWTPRCFEREIDVPYCVLTSHQAAENPDTFHVSDCIGVMVEHIDTPQEIIQYHLRLSQRCPARDLSAGNSLTFFRDRKSIFEFDQSAI
jgi:hypothetical protein